MPPRLPLNSDGFEDPDEFFKSPNTTIATPHQDSAIQSIVSALSRTPGAAEPLSDDENGEGTSGRSGGKSRGSVNPSASVLGSVKRKGRMSRLAGDSDDELGIGGGEDLMGEEEEFADGT
jgi:hypothetical protein